MYYLDMMGSLNHVVSTTLEMYVDVELASHAFLGLGH